LSSTCGTAEDSTLIEAFHNGSRSASPPCLGRRFGVPFSAPSKPVDLFARPDTASFVDATTGSKWDFAGRATRGATSGRQLQRIEMLRDYWFDWRTYHPDTSIFKTGLTDRAR
jgi:hypothetical protein